MVLTMFNSRLTLSAWREAYFSGLLAMRCTVKFCAKVFGFGFFALQNP